MKCRKLTLTMAGSKMFRKINSSICTHHSANDHTRQTHNHNFIAQQTILPSQLEHQQCFPEEQDWSFMRQEQQRLADLGVSLNQQTSASSSKYLADILLFEQKKTTSQVKRCVTQKLQQLKKQQLDYPSADSSKQTQVTHTISKAQTLKYRNPFAFWFSCDQPNTKSNRPVKMGISVICSSL